MQEDAPRFPAAAPKVTPTMPPPPKADLVLKPGVECNTSEGWFRRCLHCSPVTLLQAIFFDLIRGTWYVFFFFPFLQKGFIM